MSRSARADAPPQPRPAYGLLIAAVFAVLLLLFIYNVAEILLLLFIAVLFSLYLGAITDFLQKRFRIPRGAGLGIALLLTLVGVTAVGWLIIPPVLAQTQALLTTLPALLTVWERGLLQLADRYPILVSMLPEPGRTGSYFTTVFAGIGGYFSGLFPYLFDGLHVVIDVFSVLVMGIYLTLRPSLYREGAVALAPPVHRELVRDIFVDLSDTLRAWIVGQILAMTFLGLFTYVGLVLLRVPYPIAFGVFTAAVAIVPFFGTLVSTLLPALFVLSSGGPVQAFWVVMLGLLVHLVEANYVVPLIMERKVHLPPVLSILSVLIMAELLGLIGLLVAVPVLATVMVVVRRIYVHRLLEGRGFRRFVRDAPVEIRIPAGAARFDPALLNVSVPALLESAGLPGGPPDGPKSPL